MDYTRLVPIDLDSQIAVNVLKRKCFNIATLISTINKNMINGQVLSIMFP